MHQSDLRSEYLIARQVGGGGGEGGRALHWKQQGLDLRYHLLCLRSSEPEILLILVSVNVSESQTTDTITTVIPVNENLKINEKSWKLFLSIN